MTNIERKVYINNDLDIVMARMQAREMAKQMGFGTVDQARISLAASELARLLVWTPNQQPGELLLAPANKNGSSGMQVVCLLPFLPAYECNEEEIPEEVSKRNHSLAGARHLVDESFIEPQDEQHTRVTLTKWLITER